MEKHTLVLAPRCKIKQCLPHLDIVSVGEVQIIF